MFSVWDIWLSFILFKVLYKVLMSIFKTFYNPTEDRVRKDAHNYAKEQSDGV